MRFVPSAIHSTPASRRLPRLVDVLINLTKNMVSETNSSESDRLRFVDLSLFCVMEGWFWLHCQASFAIL